MTRSRTRSKRAWTLVLPVTIVAAAVMVSAGTTQAGPNTKGPKFSEAVAFDVSQPLSVLAKNQKPSTRTLRPVTGKDTDSELTAEASARSVFSVIASLFAPQAAGGQTSGVPGPPPTISPTIANFEGVSNQDNFNLFGFRVNPPDPVGDVGPNHYVEMVNLAYAVYSKTGTLLAGPIDTGALWAGFPITDCTDPSGDPVVVYDQIADRWLLSQFTTAGPTYYECIAISVTGDPTGAYYRYPFSTGLNFPDYPKLGVWRDSYVLTTREFGPTVEYGIGVYALERGRMLNGKKAQAAAFFLDGNDPKILPLVGDGLLPPDLDGRRIPDQTDPAPLVGTQDDNAFYGATSDALNIWDLKVKWSTSPTASLTFAAQLAVDPFNSIFPCGGNPGQTARDCLLQPGVAPTALNLLDILSYRQRPTYRLAYRNFVTYAGMVTNQ